MPDQLIEKRIERPKRLGTGALFVVLIFVLFMFFAIDFTPNWVANNLSPDGILEQNTIFQINLIRLGFSILSIIGLFVSALYINKPELFYLLQLRISEIPLIIKPQHWQEQGIDFKLILLVILGFWVLFSIYYPLNQLIAYLGLGTYFNPSEYRLSEQLSKYYLLITILVSIHSYVTQHLRSRVKLSICFLLFGLTLYLSESNMIVEIAQPIFGFIILSYTFFLLAKNREWIVFYLLFIACIIFSFTALNDLAIDYKNYGKAGFFITLLPEPMYDYLSSIWIEEALEPIGAAFVCLSVIIYSIESLTRFFQKNKYPTLGFLFSAGMIAVGNSYLHWQQHPGPNKTLISLTLTIIGFLGLILISQNTNKKYTVIGLPTLENFFLFLLSFFVVLPTVFGRSNNIISLLLWLPTIIFLGIFLYIQHPCQKKA